jgi:hypothetical protein
MRRHRCRPPWADDRRERAQLGAPGEARTQIVFADRAQRPIDVADMGSVKDGIRTRWEVGEGGH